MPRAMTAREKHDAEVRINPFDCSCCTTLSDCDDDSVDAECSGALQQDFNEAAIGRSACIFFPLSLCRCYCFVCGSLAVFSAIVCTAILEHGWLLQVVCCPAVEVPHAYQ